MEVDDTRVRAQVQDSGGQSHGVGLEWSRVPAKRALHVFCSCRGFSEGKPCKHLWATLLALNELGPEGCPPGKDRVGLRKDNASRWRDLGVSPAAREARNFRSAKRPARRPNRRNQPSARRGRTTEPSWRTQLTAIREEVEKLADLGEEPAAPPALATRGIRFFINTTASLAAGGLVLDIFAPKAGAAGQSGEMRRISIPPEELEGLLRPEETPESLAVVTALPAGPQSHKGRSGPRRRAQRSPARTKVQHFRLPPQLFDSVLPHLCAHDALGWWDGRPRSGQHRLSWDVGSPWQLALRLEIADGMVRLSGGLERSGESLPLSAPLLILPAPENSFDETADEDAPAEDAPAEDDSSEVTLLEPTAPALVVFAESVARLEAAHEQDLAWIELMRDSGEIVIPRMDLEEAITLLFEIPGLPHLEAPEELQLSEERSAFRPHLVLESDAGSVLPDPPLLANLLFDYGSLQASAEDPRAAIVDWHERKFLRRDMEGEHSALVRLLEAGVRPVASYQGHVLELNPRELASVAEPLLTDGWEVEVRGTSLRTPGSASLKVESGIDWFELSGSTEFAGDQVELKEIVAAVARGDRFVELSDGSQGLLPASWMETYESLAKLAHDDTEDALRFLPSQALLFDALLMALPPANVDRAFAKLRDKLRSFESIKPKKEPRGFRGELREYQRDGLGWLGFLREFGLGGVLADDMGLGKTVQVLALMRANRTKARTTGLPSLVVAPRSLVYNWIEEAARFTPTLSFVEYLGPDRKALQKDINKYDALVTTYGTLRRDVDFLAKVEFDTVILDEAQAIKNRDSQSAKATRLLNARNRLCLTGTPIENHLGELGSLFEFLNPGLLGTLPRLDVLRSGRTASREELGVVAEGIRPFILRRTKAQVLKDLPPKTEQILYCTLHPEQRELYDQLRGAYQQKLLTKTGAKKKSGTAIQVLEALLRLRQVACHPGLVDPDWVEAGSAKLETLFEQVSEVLEEGHKLLIFSQFTKLLAFVREHLDEQETPYAYLDGQTRNRAEVVDRFQTDPSCNLFLISLKAGGLGLNLTAAGYVFLLDPWWNPAVEAQAIDRTHRIGQTQPVFSYRLIARDTVEEKILELQSSKRQIADAILEGEGVSLRDLTADDLKMLLS